MDNSGGFRYKMLGHVGLLEENLGFFLSPLGSLKFWDFLGFLFVPRLSFHSTLACASAAGAGGVVGFCGLGDRTFEADFNS